MSTDAGINRDTWTMASTAAFRTRILVSDLGYRFRIPRPSPFIPPLQTLQILPALPALQVSQGQALPAPQTLQVTQVQTLQALPAPQALQVTQVQTLQVSRAPQTPHTLLAQHLERGARQVGKPRHKDPVLNVDETLHLLAQRCTTRRVGTCPLYTQVPPVHSGLPPPYASLRKIRCHRFHDGSSSTLPLSTHRYPWTGRIWH
ncbi:hypothetical protein L202_00690 [Cryptococcus amylolentus CBS 6039]|uniref:Uncharacterized protein n=1 Tax=Cryptococcus amylolentus CBS 6039 TaxID=1295533 RepID=A0A1E3I8W4_9TREE|nr:hypothetical protein L202_00690 [Cryptococcus amylolentus CBS 6039]ODN84825.1 hypothetical protein L202_00690 [Cryptococcus amylolentus CBS 6039]